MTLDDIDTEYLIQYAEEYKLAMKKNFLDQLSAADLVAEIERRTAPTPEELELDLKITRLQIKLNSQKIKI